jgi:ADP-glucose pyrophosphorylase
LVLRGATVESGAKVHESIIGPGAKVGKDEHVREAILACK